MSKTKGRVTLPSESNFLNETKEMLDRWGADALRDSDGTKLDAATKALDAKIYTTYFVARGHNEFAQEHMDECQQMLLMSKHNVATEDTVTIDFLDGYYREQVVADYVHDPKKWWEVIDRTTGEVVPVSCWEVDQEKDLVTIKDAAPSMSTPFLSLYMRSGILLRCTTTSPITGVINRTIFHLMCVRQTPAHLQRII